MNHRSTPPDHVFPLSTYSTTYLTSAWCWCLAAALLSPCCNLRGEGETPCAHCVCAVQTRSEPSVSDRDTHLDVFQRKAENIMWSKQGWSNPTCKRSVGRRAARRQTCPESFCLHSIPLLPREVTALVRIWELFYYTAVNGQMGHDGALRMPLACYSLLLSVPSDIGYWDSGLMGIPAPPPGPTALYSSGLPFPESESEQGCITPPPHTHTPAPSTLCRMHTSLPRHC